MIVKKTHVKRFWSKVQKTDSCWLWIGAIHKGSGYGAFWIYGQNRMPHRFAYRLLVGEIPEGLTLDHLCRVRNCVNPAHLEPVTKKENLLRGEGICAKNGRKTHCKRGHKLSGENLYIRPDGYRACQACQRVRRMEYAAKSL